MGLPRTKIPLGWATGLLMVAVGIPALFGQGLPQPLAKPMPVPGAASALPQPLAKPMPVPGAPSALPPGVSPLGQPVPGGMAPAFSPYGQPGSIPASAFPNLQPQPATNMVPAPLSGPVSILPDWPITSLMPEKVRVGIHYAIKSDRLSRVGLYRKLVQSLEAAGFERDQEDDPDPTEPENNSHVLFTGLLPAKSLERVANLAYVRSILTMPVDFDATAQADKPVRVDLMLARPSRAALREASMQTRKALDGLGFKEAGIYDSFQGTRLLGSLPANQLLKVGSLLGVNPTWATQAAPFQSVLLVCALPSAPLPTPMAAIPEVPAGFAKVAPELRQPLSEAGKVFRVEILLDRPFPSQTVAIQELAKWAPNLVFESLLGSSVTVVGSSETIRALANDPKVNGIRPGPVAHAGPFQPSSFPAGVQWDPLRPHPLTSPGTWVIAGKTLRNTVALIDDDFRGAAQLSGWKEGTLKMLDLTRERDMLLQPDPYPGPANELGRGTAMAKQLLATQPGVKLVLIRIDPSVPAMIQRVAKAIQGEDSLADELMGQRLNEIRNDRIALSEERERIEADWKENGDDFGEEPEALKKRAEYQAKLADMKKKETLHHQRLERFLNHQNELVALKEVRLVLCPLVWHEGLPRGGASPLSRWFDDRPFRSALWVQSAGDRPGQTWTGMFRDQDGNGIMEWVPAAQGQSQFPAEVIPLRWRPTGADVTRDELPKGAKLRVTLQWREARDPYQSEVDRDSGRSPLSSLRIRLVRVGSSVGQADARLNERITVAQPVGPPLLIDHSLRAAVFESFVDFEVPEDGRYEARLEGAVTNSIIPESVPQLPLNRVKTEIHPVVWLKTMNPQGNVVWGQPSEKPVVGVPGDAQEVLSVGTAARPVPAAPQVWDPSYLLDGIAAKPDLLVETPGAGAASSLLMAGQAILGVIHPDQDVRYWRRTGALPPGLTRPGPSGTQPTR